MNSRDSKRKKKRALRSLWLFIAFMLFAGSLYGVCSIVSLACAESLPPKSKITEKSSNVKGSNINPSPSTNAPSLTKPVVTSVKPEPKSIPKEEPDWKLLLVNTKNKQGDDFSVELGKLKSGHSVDKRIVKDLQAMLDAAKKEGLSPVICSSFRTMDKQKSLFNKKVNKYVASGYTKEEAEKEAGKWVAVPGTSEHQSGLAVDIVASSYQMLDEKQEETAEQKWLMENCYKYGFILRYPSNKSDITGIAYEPWHYRYVGKDVAGEIYEQGICLEEYLEKEE